MIRPDDSPHHRPITPSPNRKREDIGERQADEPVAAEVPEHRRPRIAEAAQHAGGDSLQAVEQLKHRGDGQQATRRARARRDREVNARDQLRAGSAMKTSAATLMKSAPKRQRGPAGTGRAARIAASDGLADAHRAGRRDAERHHEREAGEVQRDLVRGERHRQHPSGERRSRRRTRRLRASAASPPGTPARPVRESAAGRAATAISSSPERRLALAHAR